MQLPTRLLSVSPLISSIKAGTQPPVLTSDKKKKKRKAKREGGSQKGQSQKAESTRPQRGREVASLHRPSLLQLGALPHPPLPAWGSQIQIGAAGVTVCRTLFPTTKGIHGAGRPADPPPQDHHRHGSRHRCVPALLWIQFSFLHSFIRSKVSIFPLSIVLYRRSFDSFVPSL